MPPLEVTTAPGGALAAALAARGFNILLPLSEASFDLACAPVAPALNLRALLPDAGTGAAGAIIVANGGPAMFRRFRAAPEATDGRPHPLDRFTRSAVDAAAEEALGGAAGAGIAYRLYFPFTDSVPALPFQRLGRAAGLGAPGPLGLQIHPGFGPWWAYRALIAIAGASIEPAGAPVGDGCAGCPAPCVAACPAGAVRLTGFSVVDCHARRLTAPACHLSCDARVRCVRGVEHRYTEEQLAFHMAASMPVRRP